MKQELGDLAQEISFLLEKVDNIMFDLTKEQISSTRSYNISQQNRNDYERINKQLGRLRRSLAKALDISKSIVNVEKFD